jgi:hypothetical protein
LAKQGSQAKKLWKSIADHQKLKVQVLKLVALRTYSRLWKGSEAEDHQKLQLRIWSKRNEHHSRTRS